MENLPKSDICCACGACATVCNHDALTLSVNSNGYLVVTSHQDKCINCGLCERVCPILKPRQNEEFSGQYYACWNQDAEFRKGSASGGAFSAIAAAVIKAGGVVYGAVINGFDIEHRRVDSMVDLPPLLGSKYQQGNLTGVYSLVKKDLKEGRMVLFSGMSCQVAALKSFLGKMNCDNLYTIDTICGGFSTMLPMIALKESGRYSGIHSFRDKDNG